MPVFGIETAVYKQNNEHGGLFLQFIKRDLYIMSSGEMDALLFKTLRIVRISDGYGKWRIGTKLYNVGKGDIVILSNTVWRKVMGIDSDALKLEILEFAPETLSGNFECLNLFFRSEDSNFVISPKNEICRKAERLFFDICTELMNPGEMSREYLKGMLVSLLVLLNRQFISDGSYSPKKDKSDVLKIVTDLIWKNISREIDTDELCSAAHVSRSHLSSLFKKYCGLSIAAYIRQCRVINVIQIIKWNDINILDAAYQSGFSSSSGFYKTFKTVTGVSPKTYLKYKLDV